MDALTKRSVRASTEIRDALCLIQNISAKERAGSGYYRLNRVFADLYLQGLPKWETKIRRFFNTLREQGKSVVFVDVCGRATGASLGADKSYSFSLQPVDIHHFCQCEKEVRVRGDVFIAADFYSFVRLIRSNGDKPALVTFKPVAGLQSYSPRRDFKDKPGLHYEVIFQRLKNNLRKMIEVMMPGGFMLLEHPFQLGDSTDSTDFLRGAPQDQYKSSLWVSAFCKEMRCSVEIKSTLCGPVWLIRKRKVRRR